MIIVLNNKSNLTKEEYKSYFKTIDNINTKHNLVLCPSYINIGVIEPKNISLGAQNVSSSLNGAYTGEISAEQLKSFNVKYCIVGHSERRQTETYKEINSKIKRLLEQDITPILCVGETNEEKNKKIFYKVINEEILSAISDLSKKDQEKIIIAYEPLWAIGTGKIPTLKELNDIINMIKKILPNNKILYGGSINNTNVDTFKNFSLIDGFLLGSLSLKAFKLNDFLKKLENMTN